MRQFPNPTCYCSPHPSAVCSKHGLAKPPASGPACRTIVRKTRCLPKPPGSPARACRRGAVFGEAADERGHPVRFGSRRPRPAGRQPAAGVADQVGQQGVRPARGHPQHLLRRRRRRVRQPARSERLRQEHAADDDRRARRVRPRARSRSTARKVAGPRRETGVVFQSPVLLPWRTVLDNVLFPVELLRLPAAQLQDARAGAAAHGQDRRLRRRAAAPAVGRHAPARRHLPRAGARSGPPADGRAVQRARRHHPRRDGRGAAAHLAGQPQDRRVRHPQHPRGRIPVRPRAGDEPAAGHHRRRGCDRPAEAAPHRHDGGRGVQSLRAPSAQGHRGEPCAAEQQQLPAPNRLAEPGDRRCAAGVGGGRSRARHPLDHPAAAVGDPPRDGRPLPAAPDAPVAVALHDRAGVPAIRWSAASSSPS